MIIKCKNCNTNYVIADNSIGQNGKNVKCAKCNYEWVENQPVAVEQTNSESTNKFMDNQALTNNISSMVADIQKVKKSTSLIVIETKSRISKILYYSPIIMLFSILIAINSFYGDIVEDSFPNWVSLFKIVDIKDLKDVEISEIQVNSKNNLSEITCKISNYSNVAKKISYVRAKIFDKNDKLIMSYLIDQNLSLGSNEMKDIEKDQLEISPDAEYILLTANNFNI